MDEHNARAVPEDAECRSPVDADPTTPADSHRASVMRLEGAVSELIVRVRRFYAHVADEVSPGMLPGTYKLFSAVARLGPVTLSTIADRLLADMGMLSRQVSELERLGLVERTPDPDDRRSRLISVTDEGARRLHAARRPYEAQLAASVAHWPVETIDQLSDLLLAFALGEQPDSGPRRMPAAEQNHTRHLPSGDSDVTPTRHTQG